MKRTRFTEEQIIGVLKEAEAGAKTADLTWPGGTGCLKRRSTTGRPSMNAALADIERFGVVEEITGKRRGRVFGYCRYLAILSEGTEPLSHDCWPEQVTANRL